MDLFPQIPGSAKCSNAVICAALAAVCLAVYAHTLFFGITFSDDEVLITGNIPFLQHLPNLFRVFTTDAFYLKKSIDLYRPLQSASFIIDAQWGLNPVFTAHLTNLILHILACLTVFELLILLEFREKIAFFGGLIYATHYLFMTAVAWLPARGDLLLALFTFLALATFIKAIGSGGWKYYLLHGIFFTLAIFSKESAIVIPLLLALYLWGYGRTAAFRRSQLLLIPFYVAVQAGYFWLKTGAVVTYKGDTGLIPLLKNLRTLPETVAKFYFPLNMSTLPAYQLAATVTGVLLIAVLLALHLCRQREGRRRSLFFAGWLLLFMVPGMLYFPVFYYFAYEHVDHRTYVTCFGLLLLTLDLVQSHDLDAKRYFNPAALLLLVYLATFNLYFSGSYRNPSAFALRAIKTNPKSAQAYYTYGNELFLQGRDDEALDNLSRSIRLFGKYMPALYTRALIYRKRGLGREALNDLDTLLAADPVDADAYSLRGAIKIDLKDYKGAMTDFTSAVRLSPGHTGALKGMEALERTVSGGVKND